MRGRTIEGYLPTAAGGSKAFHEGRSGTSACTSQTERWALIEVKSQPYPSLTIAGEECSDLWRNVPGKPQTLEHHEEGEVKVRC